MPINFRINELLEKSFNSFYINISLYHLFEIKRNIC